MLSQFNSVSENYNRNFKDSASCENIHGALCHLFWPETNFCFSQVLNSLQSLPNQQIQWLHFSSHPSIPPESLPSLSHTWRSYCPSQDPTLNLTPMCVFIRPLCTNVSFLWLPCSPSSGRWLRRHTQPAQVLLLLSPHCPPRRGGLLKFKVPNQISKPAPSETISTEILTQLVI